jgi:hypothetical protein
VQRMRRQGVEDIKGKTIWVQLTRPVTTHPFKNVTHERAATSTQWPSPIKLKVDLRFGQIRMSIDPIDSISLGSKFPDIAHVPIRPHYLHAPNVVLLHWR